MRFQDFPIKRKLVAVIVLTSLTVLSIAFATLLAYEIHSYRQAVARNLQTVGGVIAESTSVALVYDDPKSGGEVLSTLRAEPEIVAAALYDIHGQVVASHPTNAAPAEFPARPTADGAHFETARLNLFLPVMEGSRRVGTLFLRQNLDGMYDRLYAYGLLLLVVLIGAGVLAFLISSVFQRSISEPILALAEAARTVSEKEDYSVRAVPGGKDELGFLTAAFNSMLSQIQSSRAVLQESEERFRLIADNIAQFAWMSDSDGKTLWINRRYTEYTGLTLDDVRAGRGMQLLHPDHAERTIRKFRECVRTGEAWEDTFQFRGLDGNYRWFLSRAIPIRDADGKVLRWFGTNTDVTGQREAEAALHASEQQLRLVTDNAQVFIVQIDREYRYRFVNRPYAARFGVTVDAILGRTIPEVVGAQAFESFRHHVDAALSGERVVFETEIPYASLGTRWMHVIYEPERNAEGVVIGLVGVSTDITARKNIEHEVARARDEALAASRAKDNFLATLSYELRTPLNPALLLASERARDAELPPRVRADFTTIRNCVELEAHLIDDLLDHSRISHGKISIEARPIDVHAVLQAALEVVQPEIAQKQLLLGVNLSAARSMVAGDAVRLQQVFWNVLKNAVKFTPAHGRIFVTTRVAGDGLEIAVSDTGMGMTPAELERAFTVFSQGDHAKSGGSHRFGGLGLGLAISRMLVELHHGTIRGESAGRDQGSTIRIRLPLLDPKAAAATPDHGAAPSRPAPVAATTPGPRRILLVEDHEATRLALAGLLRRRGYEVVVASTVAEARDLAATHEIHVVISDLGLPDGNGHELMTELHQTRGLKGIALTGYGMEEDIARSRAAGFVAHLTKPVRVEALESAMAALLFEAPRG
jgi:PAS domain S-box-containing protein